MNWYHAIMHQKRNIAIWTLYDFANSIVMIVFFLYFSQWLVVENGVSDLSYNLLFTAGSLLLLFTAPVLGSIADRTGREQRYLNWMTVLAFAFFLSASLTGLFFPDRVFVAAAFFLFANYFYQFSFVFYNALLHFIAPPTQWGRISGIGQAGNWMGQIVGLLVTLPLATGAVILFGEPGRVQTFLPATLLFFLLSLPMLFWFRLRAHPHPPDRPRVALWNEYRSQWRQFKQLLRAPNMGLFLLAYFFFNDAIITVSNNFPIYLQNVFAVSDTTKSLLLLGILATSVIGALSGGWIADFFGLRKTLLAVLGGWAILLPLMGVVTNFALFVALTVIIGFLFGAVWTVTRATMTALCPVTQLNFGFSFYTLAERVSTLVGPLSWGLITTLLTDLGPVRYRFAVGAMTAFVLLGFFFAKRITMVEERKETT